MVLAARSEPCKPAFALTRACYLASMEQANTGTWEIRGKTVLLTGGNSGIGKATVIELVRRGAHVIFTSRDSAKGEAALRAIRASTADSGSGSVQVRSLDLASFESIEALARDLVAQASALHVIVHNAGLIQAERQETEDGFELTFGTNHLGPFYLNRLLEPLLRASAPARIVVVASNAHQRLERGLDFDDLQAEKSYEAVRVYSASKLANILFTRQLAKRLEGSGITCNCLHPGVVASSFNQEGGVGGMWGFTFKWLRMLLITPEKGARTSVFLCCEPGVATVNGAYFDSSREAQPSAAARDDEAASRLWEATTAMCPSIESR